MLIIDTTKDEYEQEEPTAPISNTNEELLSMFQMSNQRSLSPENNSSRQPLLYVDVNMGIGRGGSQRIVVCEGDTAEGLAAAFGAKHCLDLATVEKLAELLHTQIDGVLEKINEEVLLEGDECDNS